MSTYATKNGYILHDVDGLKFDGIDRIVSAVKLRELFLKDAALTPPETAEAAPVAWRWRMAADRVWNYQEDRQRIPDAIHEALYARPAPATDDRERLVEADQRYPSMFYSPDRESRIGVAHYGGVGGPLPTVTVSTLLENRPGGRWVEVQLAPDEAEQMALHLLDKVASARAALGTETSR